MARPAKFDREIVLQRAMRLFWERGYNATSMSDLIDAMDMRAGSIYSTFGSKQTLLLEVLDYYAEHGHDEIRSLLQKTASKREAFSKVFACLIGEMTCEPRSKGCLLINMLLELSNIDEQAGARVKEHLQSMKEIFKQALIAAEQSGEMRPGQNPEDSATFLIGTVYSLRVMGRAAVAKADMEVLSDQAINHVFGSKHG
ncbi:TetR/AcrR family transcriptional regulator [Rubellicoccus peritrichatus]|uniref:TetR/AcrR family transcriptional regulator n=1 Tax=Rubellicoccus peritrichatus TaxID=3080537 RepID=A0AAQ3LAK4_9BACT|nr:TetR/AcrR family transcriptional regulator [Puniceicoccus sp. CR14]WOO42305.1 TetR/AcrR family transcriptional regulator [Puniceicoccus sp. CR14]